MKRSYSSIKEKKKILNESTHSTSRSSKKKQVYNHFITLSQAMIEYPLSFEEGKISVVQKFINRIDLLPPRFQKVETLYLSSNNITTLDGLQQFTRLKNLSLANNEIDDAGSLEVFEYLPSLEVLNLNGNPICKLPNYRSLIISLLPNLKTFDGKIITPDEKHKSEVNLRTQGGLLDLLLTNYCELIKLNNFHKKLDLHKELLSKNSRFMRNFVHTDVVKWKKMYDFEKQLDSYSKNTLKSNLLRDVTTIKSELNLKDEENEVAFSELILRQQQKIGELLFRAEETMKHMTVFYSRNYSGRSTDLHNTSMRSPTTATSNTRSPKPSSATPALRNKSKQVTISDAKSGSIFDEEPKALKVTKKQPVKTPSNLEQDLFQKLSHSQSSFFDHHVSPSSLKSPTPHSVKARDFPKFPSSLKNSTYLNTELRRSPSMTSSPVRHRIPEPSKLATSPSHKDECCRHMHRKVDGSTRTTGFEGTRSPLNKRLAEKEQLIDHLSKDLRSKTQELIKFEGVNQRLLEKLQSFQGQNDLNVKLAQEEIEALTQEFERNIEFQQTLEETVRSLKQELGDVYRKSYDYDEQGRRLEQIEAKAKSYARELEERTLEENNTETAISFRGNKLKAKVFKMFRKRVKAAKSVREVVGYSQNKRQQRTLESTFESWARITAISNLIKDKKKVRETQAQISLFKLWKNCIRDSKKVRYFIADMNERALQRSIVAWKQFVTQATQVKQLNNKMDLYFINRTKKRAFKRLVDVRKRNQFDLLEEKTLTKKAQKYNAFAIKRQIFVKWQKWTREEAKPLRRNNQKGEALCNKNLLKLGLGLWKKYIIVNKQIIQKAKKKAERKKRDLVAKSLKAWKLYLSNILPQRKKELELQQTFTKKRLLKVWVGQFHLKQELKVSTDHAIKFRQAKLVKTAFKHLAKLRLKKKQLHFYANVIQTKRSTAQTNKYFSKWSNLFRSIQDDRREARETRREALNIHFQAWKKFHNTVTIEKIKEKNLERHINRAERNHITNVLQGWFNYTRLKRRNREILDVLASRRRLTLYKGVLFELMKNSRQSIKQTMNRLATKSALLEANARDNANYVDELDEEKVELRNRTAMYQEDVARLNVELQERDREINNMKRVLQQCEKNERNLHEEAAVKGSIVKELETKIHRNGSDHEYMCGEYEKEIELLKEERISLLRKVGVLENELEFKQRNLVETEKTLLEKSNQAHTIVKDVEKKFVNSVKMANEFRNVIEVKDDQVGSLVAQLQRALEEKEGLKNKLNEAMITTKESRDFYEGRMKVLETQNLEMLSNMEYLRGDVGRQQKFITDLKADLRKSQHRVEILNDKAYQEDQNFVKSLRKEASFAKSNGFASPSRAKSPNLDQYRREVSAERNEYNSKKQEIDRKIHILEDYMTHESNQQKLTSPPSRLNKSQSRHQATNSMHDQRHLMATSMRSFRTESTHLNDSELEVPTKDVSKQAGFFKATNFSASLTSGTRSPIHGQPLSLKNLQSRDRSPMSTRSPKRVVIDVKDASGANDFEFEKMKKQRAERRDELEKRLENLTQSLKTDLHKARSRAYE